MDAKIKVTVVCGEKETTRSFNVSNVHGTLPRAMDAGPEVVTAMYGGLVRKFGGSAESVPNENETEAPRKAPGRPRKAS